MNMSGEGSEDLPQETTDNTAERTEESSLVERQSEGSSSFSRIQLTENAEGSTIITTIGESDSPESSKDSDATDSANVSMPVSCSERTPSSVPDTSYQWGVDASIIDQQAPQPSCSNWDEQYALRRIALHQYHRKRLRANMPQQYRSSPKRQRVDSGDADKSPTMSLPGAFVPYQMEPRLQIPEGPIRSPLIRSTTYSTTEASDETSNSGLSTPGGRREEQLYFRAHSLSSARLGDQPEAEQQAEESISRQEGQEEQQQPLQQEASGSITEYAAASYDTEGAGTSWQLPYQSTGCIRTTSHGTLVSLMPTRRSSTHPVAADDDHQGYHGIIDLTSPQNSVSHEQHPNCGNDLHVIPEDDSNVVGFRPISQPCGTERSSSSASSGNSPNRDDVPSMRRTFSADEMRIIRYRDSRLFARTRYWNMRSGHTERGQPDVPAHSLPSTSSDFSEEVPESDSDPDQCVICLSPIRQADIIRVLPCAHIYHSVCMDRWLEADVRCPVCRRSAVSNVGPRFEE